MPKQKTAPPALPVKFTGGANYLTGLPTRDMPLNDWLAHSLELRAVALKHGLYALAETDDPDAFAKVAAMRLAESAEPEADASREAGEADEETGALS